MYLGITLLFKTKKDNPIEGILISCIIKFSLKKKNLQYSINLKVKEIIDHFDYEYIGINDIFYVTGLINSGEIIGRTTYYDYETLEKANTLIKSEEFIKYGLKEVNVKKVCFSVIYFCENYLNESFTILIKLVLSNSANVYEEVINICNSKDFINKIKSFSRENLKSINFLGLESIVPMKYDFDIFEILDGTFDNYESLKNEIITDEEFQEQLKDITR